MPDVFVNQPLPEETPKTETQKRVIPGHTHSRLSAFSLYPDDVGFETKDGKERIILLLRQHPVVNVRWVVITLLLLTGPTLLDLLGVFSLMPVGFPLVISLAWYLFTVAYATEGFLNWYFNVYFVTDARIIDVDFYNLIGKRVSNAEIEMIQDVSYTTGGVLGTMLNYGNVLIQTAAEVSEFQFESVPNPEKVVKILDDLRAKV
ncbi:MAG: hypothetical protein UX13_C0016G0023 [Candidatus Woesebacteria bacterium GW2011_GWB1_45_5]|uniref:Uncharacterized protein n=1 Tax=Candidatus Woesebacteria bacterium GW2011_GWB1_45_5 TaxID=1618581 RepID=A0A0G1MPJ2_9BACT|nr:MAG: hypothetical protein UX13_C0016G0023 [Candidatus Woesebacteria bacterium GW2011_GWB1_45_5]